MTSMPRLLLLVASIGTVALVATARAQEAPPDSNSNIKFLSSIMPKKPKAGLPDVKPQPMAWPRLDPGAVLCRTEDDLAHLTMRRNGEAVDGPIDCQMIRNATAISIVQRQGPGRTEVKINAAQADDTGWTDVWLPDKAPAVKKTAATQ
jgi:hypothetical protein